jgi:hypothetical protein
MRPSAISDIVLDTFEDGNEIASLLANHVAEALGHG